MKLLYFLWLMRKELWEIAGEYRGRALPSRELIGELLYWRNREKFDAVELRVYGKNKVGKRLRGEETED